MIPGRKNELGYLNTAYGSDKNSLLIVYGQKGVGKTTLLMDFAKGKDCVYYLAAQASEREHRYLFCSMPQFKDAFSTDYPDWTELMDAVLGMGTEKKVLIIDEFENIVRSDPQFMDAILHLLGNDQRQVMIIFSSSAVGFVENRLVGRIGRAALSITGFLKIRPLKYEDISAVFSDYNIEDRIAVLAILGGIPGLWKYFDPQIPLKQNIIENILTPGKPLFNYGCCLVTDLVREGAVYSTILAGIARGYDKLGELYEHTLFSRAKLSVYLKNLMELELIEKTFSIDTRGRDMQRKGIYKICFPFALFWFKYIYPNISTLYMTEPSQFYEKYIGNDLFNYSKDTFSSLCRSYMDELAKRDVFDFEIERSGVFDGKRGYMDYLGFDELDMKCVAAFSCYDKPYMPYEDYEKAVKSLADAKAGADIIYLFARDGFDEKIKLKASMEQGRLRLLTMNDWLGER
ncbi:MAG: ATP-binding protein [Lachnospiraceae bacterium]|nr:ATP-binding protein [Lachnospiraceae bacterium]